MMIGALHHLSQPALAIQNISKKMKRGGLFFSYDPHKSPARFIFDLAMKINKLYVEEASEDPLFSEKKLRSLLEDSGIYCNIKLSTYLLPHFFSFFCQKTNLRILQITDRIFNSIPILRKLGGMVISEGIRK